MGAAENEWQEDADGAGELFEGMGTMLNPIKTIVVGVPDPDGTDPILHHALSLAGRLGATLHVVHAYPAPAGAVAFDPAATLAVMDGPVPGPGVGQMEELEESLSRRLRAEVTRGSPAATVEVHLEAGPPAGAIARVHEETRADLVLLGATRHHGISRAVLGTTAGRVLREVHAPVLVLRAAPTTSRVLLTTDLSDLSVGACTTGVVISQALRAAGPQAFGCVHVVGLPLGDIPPTGVDLEASAREGLRRFLEGIPELPAGVEAVIRVGAPAEEIVSEAGEWGADLVILGTHGRTGISRLFLGSVAEGVVRDLECNALVIPPASREAVPHQA